MNYYAYPLIFDAMKSTVDNYMSIELSDSLIYIYRKNDIIYVKDDEKTIVYHNNFNFFINKPIIKITIIYDKYGHRFSEIFNKSYFRAAITIQRKFRQQ